MLDSLAQDSDADGEHHVQNDAASGLKRLQDGLTEPAGPANVSFSMLLPMPQQDVTTAKSVGTPERGQESMDIDIVSCSF